MIVMVMSLRDLGIGFGIVIHLGRTYSSRSRNLSLFCVNERATSCIVMGSCEKAKAEEAPFLQRFSSLVKGSVFAGGSQRSNELIQHRGCS